MMKIKKGVRVLSFGMILHIISVWSGVILAQGEADREKLINISREMMESAHYCALITIDSTGHSSARMMDPFLPEEDLIVWMGTNINSRKIREIRNNPVVTLYYSDPDGGGYITISGTAELVDDPGEKTGRWKESWESFYSEDKDNYILIKVTPDKVEVLSYKHGITGNQVNWRTPVVEF